MREKLVRSDLLECVIGLGPNLFYNSPMEACIVVCRSKKPENHKGQILFINAVNEVTRKNAQSYLDPQHIDKIAKAYEKFESDNDIAKKVSIRDIEKNDFSLSIPLYVKDPSAITMEVVMTVQDSYDVWLRTSQRLRAYYEALGNLLKREE